MLHASSIFCCFVYINSEMKNELDELERNHQVEMVKLEVWNRIHLRQYWRSF